MDFKRYLTEAAIAAEQPVTGDAFDISVNEMLNVECSVVDHGPGSVTIMLDERAISMLEHCGCQFTGESSADEPESDDIDQDDKRYDDAEDAEDDEDNEKIEESSHVVKHATHGAVYAKDGKAKLFMTRREAEEVADAMASKHGGSGISVTQAPYTGYFVKMPETKIEEADYSETDSHGPYARGAADADYGRKYEPHKFVDNGKGGKIKEVLTDLGEIAQYKKGYTTGGVDKQDFSEQIAEAIKLNSKVRIHDPGKKHHGEEGTVVEFRRGLPGVRPSYYTVDHGGTSTQFTRENIKTIKEEEEADQIDEANSHRKVDDLKSKGKHHEAGQHAAKSGHDRQYGAHFGMRSDKEEAQRQFFKGYDSVKKTNEEAEIDEALGSIDNFKKASKFGPERVGAMIRGEKARKAEMAKVSIKRPIGHRVVAVGPNQTEKEISKQNFEEEVDHKKERSELINKAAGHNIPSKMREKIRKAADLHGMAAKDPEKYAAAALAASKALNEEDDGWYAHHEIHGSKGISKEDWKKGVRMNSKGERVKTTKEEAERIDELSRTGILQRYSDKTRRLVDRGVEEPEKREKMRFLAGKKRWGSTGGIASAKVPATNEEVEFSDAEIARIEAILNTVE